jgi:GntR family transcriptional regulator, transcriptional repressor for pyruvate dehydrogenase complex
MNFQPVGAYERIRISDLVADQIQSLICEGELLPGQRLPSERVLSIQLNVSRPSLREALTRLKSNGYIKARGRGGFLVADIMKPVVSSPLAELLLQHPRVWSDVIELRQNLETISITYAVERATPTDLRKIQAAFDKLSAVMHDSRQLAEKDTQFHLAIANATHNVALIHVMHGLYGLIQESIRNSHYLINFDEGIESTLHRQHSAIRDAIFARDTRRARQAIDEHLHYVRALYEHKSSSEKTGNPRTKRAVRGKMVASHR